MCCEEEQLSPPPVAEMLARYRSLLVERRHDWGNETNLQHFIGLCDQDKLMDAWDKLIAAFSQEQEVPGPLADLPAEIVELVVGALPDPLPDGVALARGTGVKVRDPLPFALTERPTTYQVLTVGEGDAPTTVTEAIVSVERPELEVYGHSVRAVEPAVSGRLRLVSDAASRWTVLDERGGAWFPDDMLRKYDYHGRAFFHGNNITLEVPVGRITVSVARGCEFRPASVEVGVTSDEETLVELSPTRVYDAAARGWYGGDMHVHMNYSGDLVCTPPDAARMQQGEGLHLMNLVAANRSTALIYDREAFEHFIGQDLPWSQTDTVARWGIEYRNDLLGHFHVLNLATPPTRYQTGHKRSEEPQDWPPNAVAAAECRDLGATVGYTHPLMVPLGDDGSPTPIFAGHVRDCQARELVADAALGLVDSVDLTGIHNLWGTKATEYLYHRLLGCGLRLAATAGTDSMLSHSRGSVVSNPPGWSRAYANLGGKPLSVVAWQDAVRAGRTFATNGPWLELDVAGHGPGDTIALDRTGSVSVVARVVGLGVETLEIVGPDGPIATIDVAPDAEEAELTADLDVAEPMWLAAAARGGIHPAVLGPQVYAHTSPVWVEVAGQSIARPGDAAWCLDWLDRFEALVRKVGNFTDTAQLDDLIEVVDRARVFYRNIAAAARSSNYGS